MSSTNVLTHRRTPLSFLRVDLPGHLGILFGIVMPIVSIALFRTYTDSMPVFWLERARLLELQFVTSEMAVILAARHQGFMIRPIWQNIPGDVRLALLIVLAAMMVSSSLLATAPADALLQSTIQIVHCLFALAVYFLARKARVSDWAQMVAWLVAGLLPIALATAWWFAIAPPESAVPGGRIVWDQAIPGFISVRYLGTWLGGIAAFLAVKQLYRDRNDRLTFDHIVFMLVLALTFWTGTRAAIIGIAAALVGIAFTMRRLPTPRAMLAGTAIAATALALATVFAFDNPAFALYAPNDLSSAENFTAGRLELWAATVERWAQSPLLGWGTGSLVWDVNVGWRHTQPHNAILQYGENWGVIGLAGVCWVFWRAIQAAALRSRSNQRLLPIFAMVLAFLGMSMVDGALYYPRFIIMIVMGSAILLASPVDFRNARPAD